MLMMANSPGWTRLPPDRVVFAALLDPVDVERVEDEEEDEGERVQLPPDSMYPELHPSQAPLDEQSLQLLLYPLQQRPPCVHKKEGVGDENTACGIGEG